MATTTKKFNYPIPGQEEDPTYPEQTTSPVDELKPEVGKKYPDAYTNHDTTDPKLSTEPAGTAQMPAATTTGYDRQKVKEGIKSLKPGDDIAKYLAEHPDFTEGVTQKGEMLTLPDGETFDDVGDAGGTNTPWWGSEKDWQSEEAQRRAAGQASASTQTQTTTTDTKKTDPTEPAYQYPTLTDDWKKSFDTTAPGAAASSANTAATAAATTQQPATSQQQTTLAGQLSHDLLAQDTARSANTTNQQATTNTETLDSTGHPIHSDTPGHSDEDPNQSGETEAQRQMHAEIQRLLARGNTPVTEESVAGQYQPVANQYTRGADEAKRAAAERAAFQGTSVGGAGGSLDAENNSINEDLAGKKANTMGTLMGQELQARRADVVNALTFAQGEEKNQLTLQLAEIDRKLRQQGLDLQNKQIDVNKYLAERGLDLQKYGIDINKVLSERGLDIQKLGLTNQNQQFYDRLAFDIAHDNLSVDDIIQRLISGR